MSSNVSRLLGLWLLAAAPLTLLAQPATAPSETAIDAPAETSAPEATPAVEPGATVASTESDALQTTTLDTVVVSGKLPGPGLWKISRGDNVLWLLGTIAPLPKRMEWDSTEFEATIARSQALLLPPSVSFKTDAGFFGGLFLLPSLMKARNNPEGRMLKDMVPPELYARWTALKQQYMGRNRSVEKRRPIVAAQMLQSDALDEHDLVFENPAAKIAKRSAKKHDVEITTPSIEITIKDAKQAVREFADSPLQDVECFGRTLDRLERDMETLKLRANAWALGEVEILRNLPYTDNFRACAQALQENRIAKKQGFDDLEAQVDRKWMEAADAALAANRSSVALLPMSAMLRENGLLAQLAARGYVIEAPTAPE